MKIVGKNTGVKAAQPPAPGLSPKEGGMKGGTQKGPAANSGSAPPNVHTVKGAGNFKHPKATY